MNPLMHAVIIALIVIPTLTCIVTTLSIAAYALRKRQAFLRDGRQFGDFPPPAANVKRPPLPGILPVLSSRATLAVPLAIAAGHGLFLLFPEGLL